MWRSMDALLSAAAAAVAALAAQQPSVSRQRLPRESGRARRCPVAGPSLALRGSRWSAAAGEP